MLTIAKLLVAISLCGDARLDGAYHDGQTSVGGHIVYGNAFSTFDGYYDDNGTFFVSTDIVPEQNVKKDRKVFRIGIYLDLSGNTESYAECYVVYIPSR